MQMRFPMAALLGCAIVASAVATRGVTAAEDSSTLLTIDHSVRLVSKVPAICRAGVDPLRAREGARG